MPAAIDRTGQKYGRLTVLREAQPLGAPRKWVCLCDCGNTTTLIIREKGTKSCGCIAKEINSNRERTHGEYGTRLYNIWHDMKQRCQNANSTNYSFYGALDITVCEAWQPYEGFAEWAKFSGYADHLTLDRIEGTKGYSPNNCRWETRTTQARNQKKRNTNSSGFTGVSFHKKNQNWVSYIWINYKKINLGSHATEQDAINAREAYILEHQLNHYPKQT